MAHLCDLCSPSQKGTCNNGGGEVAESMAKNSKWASVALRRPAGHGLASLRIQACSARHMLHSLADCPLQDS